MVTVALALGSAACYGVSNFFGPLLARRHALFLVLVVSHAAALAGAAVYLLAAGGPTLHGGTLAVALLAGAGNAGGLIGFYRAAQLGPLSLVAPIGAAGAIIPIVWGLAHGDSLSALQACGIPLAVGGCALAARRAAPATETYPDPRASALWASCSAVAFGTFLTALPAASEHGRAWALFDARAALLAIIVLWASREVRGLRKEVSSGRPPASGRRHLPQLSVPGLLLFAGTLLYLLAAARGQLSLVSVLNSIAPVITVGLGVLILHERPSQAQTVGVVTALAGVVLIAT